MSLALVIAATTILRIPSYFEPHWYGDEGIFAAIGQMVLDGRQLYSEAWDNKPPLIFLLYAGVLAAFGESIPALRAVGTVAVIATQICLFHIARPTLGQARALIAPAIFGALMAYPTIEGQLTLTEGFMVALTTGSVLLALRLSRTRSASGEGKVIHLSRLEGAGWLGVGLLLGLATAFKPVAAMDAWALLIAIFVTGGSDRWSRLLRVAAGVAAPWVIFVVWFAAAGALEEFIDANVGYQLRYVATSDRHERWQLLMVGPMLAGLILMLRNRQRLEAFVALWLGFACAGAMVGGLQYNHYVIQVLPPLALAAAGARLPSRGAFSHWGSAPLSAAVRMSASAVVALGVATAVMSSTTLLTEEANEHARRYYLGFTEAVQARDVSRFHESFGGGWTFSEHVRSQIEGRTIGDDVLFWADRAWLYPLTGTKPPTRFVVDYHITGTPPREAELMEIMRHAPPAFVVVEQSRHLPGALALYLEQNYACEGDEHLQVCERLSSALARSRSPGT